MKTRSQVMINTSCSEIALGHSLILHASAVSIKKRGLLFLGHSTSGKSTISKLLSSKFPLISDDKVEVVRNCNKDWLLINREFKSDSRQNLSGFVDNSPMLPIVAVLRIFKSSKNGTEPASPLDSCKFLLDAVFEIDSQRRCEDLTTRMRWFSQVSEIARNIPGYYLTFKKDFSIVKLIDRRFNSGV